MTKLLTRHDVDDIVKSRTAVADPGLPNFYRFRGARKWKCPLQNSASVTVFPYALEMLA